MRGHDLGSGAAVAVLSGEGRAVTGVHGQIGRVVVFPPGSTEGAPGIAMGPHTQIGCIVPVLTVPLPLPVTDPVPPMASPATTPAGSGGRAQMVALGSGAGVGDVPAPGPGRVGGGKTGG